MDRQSWLRDILGAVDANDTGKFLTYLTDDAMFKFGNADGVHGKDAIGEMLKGFFGSIEGLSHTLTESWSTDGAVISRGEVTYTRKDSSTLTVPFANIFRMNGDKIKDYLIYVDASQLYA